MMRDVIHSYLKHLKETIDKISEDDLEAIAEIIFNAYSHDKQVFIIGNGGSASTASHMAADLNKNTIHPNRRRFKIHSLTDNAAITTALANDIHYDEIFSEQLMNLITSGDVLIVISGSGNSPNVINAARYARSEGAQVVSLLGFDGGAARELSDVCLVIDSNDYGVVEDLHLVINHILVVYFRKRFSEFSSWSEQ